MEETEMSPLLYIRYWSVHKYFFKKENEEMQQINVYQNNQTWQKVQEFLPQENRLNDKEMPIQEWIEMGDTSDILL